METQKQSPLPWRRTTSISRWHIVTDQRPRSFNICTLNINLPDEQQEANAALIVRACNNYYRLFDSLSALLDVAEMQGIDADPEIKAAREALAEAEAA